MSHIVRRLSHASKILQGNGTVFTTPKPVFYTTVTTETDPRKHTIKDLGLFYPIDNSLSLKCLYQNSGFSRDYVEECKTFQNTYIMIRKPALEVINCLKHTNFDNPVNRYVLYGKYGHGVSMTMAHIAHFGYVSEWLVVYIPNIISWLTAKTERAESTTKEGLIDLPVKGSDWLHNFKSMNLNVIKKYDLRLLNNYTWNIQEESKKGESLLSLIDHGIARGKYSCDVICVLLDEVQQLNKLGIMKTLVLIDNYSVFFHPGRKSSNRKYKNLGPERLSVTESLKNLAKPTWHNGAVVLSCHADRDIPNDTDHLPMNKLSAKGVEFLDPFIPIEVPKLTDLEMTNLLNFYRSKNWLSASEGDLELKVLSAGSISTLKTLCGPL